MSEYGILERLVTFRPLERHIEVAGRASPFKAKWSATVRLLAFELSAHGAVGAVLEIDVREQDLRQDGLPRERARAATPAVALSFAATKVPGSPHLRYAVGTYRDWRDNVRAIALTLEKLRAVDRYGATRRGEQYTGWQQLEAGGPSAERGARLIEQHGSVRQALFATHPDRGGSSTDFADVQAARDA